jgi:hypothetical protein
MPVEPSSSLVEGLSLSNPNTTYLYLPAASLSSIDMVPSTCARDLQELDRHDDDFILPNSPNPRPASPAADYPEVCPLTSSKPTCSTSCLDVDLQAQIFPADRSQVFAGLAVNDGITSLENGPIAEHPQPELPVVVECDLNRIPRPDDDTILQGMPSSSDHSKAKHVVVHLQPSTRLAPVSADHASQSHAIVSADQSLERKRKPITSCMDCSDDLKAPNEVVDLDLQTRPAPVDYHGAIQPCMGFSFAVNLSTPLPTIPTAQRKLFGSRIARCEIELPPRYTIPKRDLLAATANNSANDNKKVYQTIQKVHMLSYACMCVCV